MNVITGDSTSLPMHAMTTKYGDKRPYFSAIWPGLTQERSTSEPESRSQVRSAVNWRPFPLSLVCGLNRLFILYLHFYQNHLNASFASNKFASLSKDRDNHKSS
jgi:hypothetical protein